MWSRAEVEFKPRYSAVVTLPDALSLHGVSHDAGKLLTGPVRSRLRGGAATWKCITFTFPHSSPETTV